jgi:hypothetical protein
MALRLVRLHRGGQGLFWSLRFCQSRPPGVRGSIELSFFSARNQNLCAVCIRMSRYRVVFEAKIPSVSAVMSIHGSTFPKKQRSRHFMVITKITIIAASISFKN